MKLSINVHKPVLLEHEWKYIYNVLDEYGDDYTNDPETITTRAVRDAIDNGLDNDQDRFIASNSGLLFRILLWIQVKGR